MFNISKKIKKLTNYKVVRRNDVTKNLLLTGAITGLIGSVSTLLTTRKNGEQNRKEIIKASKKLGDEAKKNLEKFSEFSDEMKEKIKTEKASEFAGIKSHVKSIANKTKKIVSKIKDKASVKKDYIEGVIEDESAEEKKD